MAWVVLKNAPIQHMQPPSGGGGSAQCSNCGQVYSDPEAIHMIGMTGTCPTCFGNIANRRHE